MTSRILRTLFVIIMLLCFASLPLKVRGDAVPAAEVETFGAAGKELKVLKGGREAELYSHAGSGCLTHMWFGGDWKGYLRTRVRIYVDGEKAASIDMELGLGHGIGFEDSAAPWGITRIGKTGTHSGVYNTFRIPFGSAIHVTAQLADDVKENPDFWWIIRGSTHVPVEIAGVRLPESARLHLYKREQYTAQRLEEFDLCSTTKPGALYLVTIAGKSQGNINFLEAQMRVYLNGRKEPLMLSSGLEDYFLGTYYFQRGKYYTAVAGLTHLDPKDNSFSAYRFHDDDPIFCKSGLRLTCRCGEKAGEKTFGDPKTTTYTAYAWVYEW